jgi:chorismate mutase
MARRSAERDRRPALPGGRSRAAAGTVHALRGATQVDADDRELIIDATTELLNELMVRNELAISDVISVLFTMTPDLTAEFPAVAARNAGFGDVPLLCASEIDVAGAPPRVVRLLAHVGIDRPRHELRHVYLRGAAVLRPDIVQ